MDRFKKFDEQRQYHSLIMHTIDANLIDLTNIEWASFELALDHGIEKEIIHPKDFPKILKFLKSVPDRSKVLYSLGIILFHQGKYRKSFQAFAQCLLLPHIPHYGLLSDRLKEVWQYILIHEDTLLETPDDLLQLIPKKTIGIPIEQYKELLTEVESLKNEISELKSVYGFASSRIL